ncbi:MAG: efflux RND transporter periplasmic adaptor subunit [Alphaproteobacteria bacterium]|nr:efflux RND transporter periplasmic adaptor subunit [Alphaproteobacteria bacterium]
MKIIATAMGLALGAGLVAPLGHQALAEADRPVGGSVIVAKAATACFSDVVRVAGYLVPRRIAVVNVDSDGYKLAEVSVAEGDLVPVEQPLARLTRQTPEVAGTAAAPRPAITLRAPAAGLVMKSTARLREMASPQSEPLFQILVDNEVELEAQVPSNHLPKLKIGDVGRISIAGSADRVGKIRLVAPDIDQKTQLGKLRLAVGKDASLRIGMLGYATIDARRSCGVAIPRDAVDCRVDGASVRVVLDRTVQMRRVLVGLSSDDNVEIREGISAGDVVVANAGSSLHDGDKINPKFLDEFR